MTVRMTVRTFAGALARRGTLILAILLLSLALTLSACSPFTSGSGSGDTVDVPTATSAPPAPQQVVQADSDIDTLIAAMDAASNDASLDQQAQDNPTTLP